MGNRQSSQDAFVDVLPSTKKKVPSASVVAKTNGVSKSPVDHDAQQSSRPLSQEKEAPGAFDEANPQISSASLPSTQEENETADRFLIPESVRKSRILDEFVDVCSEIVPEFLYVSNVAVASDMSLLRALGITHVVNCCKELCAEAAASPSQGKDDAAFRSKLQVLEFALRDDTREDLTWFFYQVIDFVNDAQRSVAGKALIHCYQGISRSCAFAVAYVMHQQQQNHHEENAPLSFRVALAFVKDKRAIASPNTAFLCQLIAWEQELASFTAFSQDTPSRNVLYRLAPHAAHDPETLVLKTCHYAVNPEGTTASATQQSPVVVTYDARSWRPIVWSRGIFVFMSSPQEVTIWKGYACDIVSGVAEARRHVKRMIRVRLSFLSRGDANDQENAALHELNIVEIDEASENDNVVQDYCDRFGYADELAWMETTSPAAPSVMPITSARGNRDGANDVCSYEIGAELAALKVQGDKPLLFVLDSIDDDGEGSWDQLTEYDSEDLASSDAFLLYVPSPSPEIASCSHYLWIGSACVAVEDALIKLAMLQVMDVQRRVSASSITQTTAVPVIEREREEREQFWNAFEQGY
ncbi:Dual specificity catalytic domain containing protein, partial [Globisporangium splendens]